MSRTALCEDNHDMTANAINRFRDELGRWIAAHNETKGFTTNADEAFATLEDRIGTQALTQIGSAFLNGWLITEQEPNRGYFVRETDRPGKRGGQFVLINRGNGKADPCWELFVQLADYAWLRTIAQRTGHAVRLEDRLMDLTVRTQDALILYVEHKTTRAVAEHILESMKRHGEIGFGIDDFDKGNDALRKAKYLVRDDRSLRPLYFGLSAVGFKKLFRVEYEVGNRFRLVPDDRPFSAPLLDHPSRNSVLIPWSPVDSLALEIERLCPNVWISVGSGQTAYNFYASTCDGDAIVIGVYESGEVWTDVARLGQDVAARLAAALARVGILLDVTKKWTYWKIGGLRLDLAVADPNSIAEAVKESLGSNSGTAPKYSPPKLIEQ
jgi:hypothetical protein